MDIAVALMALSATLQPAAAQAKLDLSQVAGVHLGDTESAATAQLAEFGNVTREQGEKGALSLVAGPVNATLCQGRIVMVSLQLGTSFHEFARLAGAWMKVRGAPEPPDIFAIDASRPASDPLGALTISASTIRLSWKNAPGYALGFREVDGKHVVWEVLAEQNRCSEQ
jgi:hypothetical protein